MHTSKFHRLVAEIAERRSQLHENSLRLRHAAFTFQTGLQQVKRSISDSTANFIELTGGQNMYIDQPTKLTSLHRCAS